MPAEVKINLFQRISIKEKSLFTRSLSTMISAGLPIIRALTLLSKQTSNPTLSKVIKDVIKRLEEGEALSSAFSHHSIMFDEVYLASLKAAEASGKFEQVLQELSDQEEADYKLSSSMRAAVIYPFFIICAMIVAVIILMVLVIPKMEEIFTTSNMELPWTTKALIATSNFMINYWYILILAVVGLVVWAKYYFKSKSGREVLGQIILQTPGLNSFFISAYMTRFTRTFSMLVGAGVPIIQAIKLVGKVIDNTVYEKILNNVAKQLERGVPMSQPLFDQEPAFPAIVPQMIAVGEQTGKIDEVLLSLSRFFQDETEKRIKSLTSLLEPILLIIVGLGVGVIVFSILIPIYQISGNIS